MLLYVSFMLCCAGINARFGSFAQVHPEGGIMSMRTCLFLDWFVFSVLFWGGFYFTAF